MDAEQLNYRFLARYMEGICSDEVEQYITEWANRSEENAQKMEEFEQIWHAAGRSESIVEGPSEVQRQWDRLDERLQKEARASDKTRYPAMGSATHSSSMDSMIWKIARVAAIFLVAGLLGILAYQNWYLPTEEATEPALREISTADAQRVNLTLGDGTRVLLNADSDLKLPSEFGPSVREVFLEGEAFFEVAHNPARPFVIHSRGAVIRVLGTEFAVRAYPEESHVQVVVKEGRVSFESGDQKGNSTSILAANELGCYSVETHQIRARKVEDMQLYLGWREGYLKFRKAPMSEVARELERRYGIEVRFQNRRIKEQSLTAFLKSRSIRNVLDVIAMSLEIEYELRDNRVTFYRQR